VRLAEVMRSVQPDIIALQEVDQGTERAGGVNQLDEFARLLGMHAAFGKAMDYAGGGYGVGVLSRWPLVSLDNQPLPSSPDAEPRTALTVYVRTGQDGPLLRFTTTHLDHSRDGADRVTQAIHLNDLLVPGSAQSSVLAGDFNARQDTEVMQILDAHWTNAATFQVPPDPASPRRRGPRGDHVFFRPAAHWRVVESQIIDAPAASDHRPILTVLEWLGPS
jgi:endonuclease/exonuclease/phosphatase family metal-dependent hydrolase